VRGGGAELGSPPRLWAFVSTQGGMATGNQLRHKSNGAQRFPLAVHFPRASLLRFLVNSTTRSTSLQSRSNLLP